MGVTSPMKAESGVCENLSFEEHVSTQIQYFMLITKLFLGIIDFHVLYSFCILGYCEMSISNACNCITVLSLFLWLDFNAFKPNIAKNYF